MAENITVRLCWWGAKRKPPKGMATLPSDCREAADEIERLTRELAFLQAKAAKWDEKDGIEGAACSMIREKLDEFGAPRAAFIDDHVANGLFHARRQAFLDAAEIAEECVLTANVSEYAGLGDHAAFDAGQDSASSQIAAALRAKAEAE